MVRNDGTGEGKLNGKWEEVWVDNGQGVVPQYLRVQAITGWWTISYKFVMGKLLDNNKFNELPS